MGSSWCQTKSRDVLWPLARRRLSQRRKRLPTRRLLRPAFLARTIDPGYGRSQGDLKQRLLQDLLTYSLPCLLRYEDRNSMAFSIESRVPYLDQELVDHILHLPDTAIVKDGWSRWILREALKGTLPERILSGRVPLSASRRIQRLQPSLTMAVSGRCRMWSTNSWSRYGTRLSMLNAMELRSS